eukprot:COSAG01_NODE_36037_length_523_cov_1.094340_1_plen_103_part_01
MGGVGAPESTEDVELGLARVFGLLGPELTPEGLDADDDDADDDDDDDDDDADDDADDDNDADDDADVDDSFSADNEVQGEEEEEVVVGESAARATAVAQVRPL